MKGWTFFKIIVNWPYMIVLIYDDVNGTALKDSELEPKVNELLEMSKNQASDVHFTFANELFLIAFRAISLSKKFDHTKIEVRWNGPNGLMGMHLNEEYRLLSWPQGFCINNYLSQLMDWPVAVG
jgi:hypothetical protein